MLKDNLRTLFRHSAVYALSWGLNIVSGVLLMPVYTRYLSKADYGIIDLVQQSNVILKVVLMTGIAQAAAKFFHSSESESHKRGVVSTSLWTVSATSLLGAVCISTFSADVSTLLIGNPDSEKYFKIGAILLFFEVQFALFSVPYLIQKKSTGLLILNFIKLLLAIATNLILVVGFKLGATGMLVGNIVALLPVVLWAGARGFITFGFGYNTRILRKMLLFGLPLVPASILATLLHQVDRFLVPNLCSVEDLGMLSIGYLFPVMANAVLLTSFNEVWNTSSLYQITKQKTGSEQIGKIATYFMGCFIFLMTFLGITGSSLLWILADPKYFAAHSMIPALIPGLCFHALYTFFNVGALVKGKTYLMILGYLPAVVIKIGLCWFVLPKLGVYAAPWVSSIAYLVFSAMTLLVCRKSFPIQFEVKRLVFLFILSFLFLYLGHLTTTLDRVLALSLQVLLIVSMVLAIWFLPFFSAEEKRLIQTKPIDFLKQKFSKKGPE